jgi:hypothetical protein
MFRTNSLYDKCLNLTRAGYHHRRPSIQANRTVHVPLATLDRLRLEHSNCGGPDLTFQPSDLRFDPEQRLSELNRLGISDEHFRDGSGQISGNLIVDFHSFDQADDRIRLNGSPNLDIRWFIR